MKKICILTWLILAFYYSLEIQAQNFPISAKAAGIGNAIVTSQDAWAVFGNIGGMANVKSVTALFAYENRFGFTNGFHAVAAGVVIPTPIGNGAISTYRFGDEIFSKQKLGIGWAHQISRISIGVQANYWQHHVEGYGTRGNLVMELGGVAAIIPRLTFGLHILNVNQTKISEEEHFSTVVRVGLGYNPIDPLLLVIETEKDTEFASVFKLGMEYKLVEKLRLRTGLSTRTLRTHYGFGLYLKKFIIDYALVSHPQLGMSNQLSVAYKLK